MRLKVVALLALLVLLPWFVYSRSTGQASVRTALGLVERPTRRIEPIPPPANLDKYAEKIRDCEHQPADSMCFNILAENTGEPYFCERTAVERRWCFTRLAAASGNWQLCDHITESVLKADGTWTQRPYVADDCFLGAVKMHPDPQACDLLEARWGEHPTNSSVVEECEREPSYRLPCREILARKKEEDSRRATALAACRDSRPLRVAAIPAPAPSAALTAPESTPPEPRIAELIAAYRPADVVNELGVWPFFHLAWMPDGQLLDTGRHVFSHEGHLRGHPPSAPDRAGGLVFSPDGRLRAALSQQVPNAVFIARADGSDPYFFGAGGTPGTTVLDGFSWTPSGNEIWWVERGPAGPGRVLSGDPTYRCPPHQRECKGRTVLRGQADYLQISSRGRLAEIVTAPSGQKLRLQDLDGSNEQLLDLPASFSKLVWSPDGRFVALIAGSGRRSDLWVLDTLSDNRRLVGLIAHSGSDVAWSPNSDEIAVVIEEQDAKEGPIPGRFLVGVLPDGKSQRLLADAGDKCRFLYPAWTRGRLAVERVCDQRDRVWLLALH